MSDFNWSELAFASKKPLRDLKPIFIAAPRDISVGRLTQLIKENLSSANILLGIAQEEYIDGFEGQPQFKTLRLSKVEALIKKINNAGLKHKVYSLEYAQRDLPFILEKLKFQKVLFLNGSWKYMFHTTAPYFTLNKLKIPYALVSPFTDENEAIAYAEKVLSKEQEANGTHTAAEMLGLADDIAKRSFDYCFQTGAALGRKSGNKYIALVRSFNKVVPYQAYAMHHGSLRETNFSPMNDLNHYDTVHAEVELMLDAGKQKINLAKTTLFINLLPCPSCARMVCETPINEIVYREDHSDGYAVKMLELAGKKVTRLVQ